MFICGYFPLSESYQTQLETPHFDCYYNSLTFDQPGDTFPMPALDGIRILDMTQYEAGTSCTQALAWLGADVTKIEPTKVGEPGRGLEMGLWQDSEYFINWNSNKNSVAINLRDPKGRDILLKMLPHYDVFVENYGPGVVEKLNIDYETMNEIHPGIIYGRIKGFGTSGPYSKFKSYDTVAQAASGAMSITGEEDGPPMRISAPTKANSSNSPCRKP